MGVGKKILALGVATVMVGCAVPEARAPYWVNKIAFDEQLTKDLIADGEGSLQGTAFMRQAGGGVVTCAGFEAKISPVTPYSSERLGFIYGAAPTVGEVLLAPYSVATSGYVFAIDPPEFQKLVKKTICDAQGNFAFEGIKDGNYFVNAGVAWRVGSVQGGALITQVQVKNGKAQRVILSR